MPSGALTPESASVALAALGQRVEPQTLDPVRRDGRWMVQLPDGLMAWFAADPDGFEAMRTERRVLRTLESCCPRLTVPRVIAESSDGAIDVRLAVPGSHDAFAVYARLRDDPSAATSVGTALGTLVAEWHRGVGALDVTSLPEVPAWPKPRAWVRERLPRVVDDHVLHAAADAVMARYEAAIRETTEDERALVHTDLGLHNVSIDVDSLAVRGVFDWESACWADPHLDFRYFTFDLQHDALLDSALIAYEAATGRRLSRERVHLYNGACAVGYLAFRDGVSPDAVWCGRTLAEDLHWTRLAVARAGSAGA
jgi:aminoglycoside phosphotransferase (APT) family kinase protein